MTPMKRAFLTAICLCGLGACGSSSDSESRPEPPPVKDTAFGDMVGTMDKAKGVQDTVDTHKQDMDKQLQSQEGESEH
ncbi:MAG TPA: hypothetical protein VIT67_10920 [Povalibacter sp.]